MSAQNPRSKSRSPKREGSLADKQAGGDQRHTHKARKSRSPPSKRRSSASPSQRSQSSSKSAPKSVGYRATNSSSIAKDSFVATGKANTATSRRVTIRSADVQARGLRTVDMTEQCLTALPGNIFPAASDIGILDLGSNNLRDLPAEIKEMRQLVQLNLSRNGIRCTSPRDYLGIPRQLASLSHLEVLIISECNLPHIPPVIWECKNLRVLDISRNKISVLLPEIGNLEQLQHLNAMQTSITTVPPEIAFCQELEDILLWGNTIESLPGAMKHLPKLKYLAINFRSFCSSLDEYMQGLLKTGQIKSEHIPSVLFEMPALDVLDLDDTMLNCLPGECVARLRDLHLANNYFQTMPPVLSSMNHLEFLDISDNSIENIPEGIGNMTNLETLKMNNNKVARIPPTIVKLTKLVELSLSGNRIRELPDEVGDLMTLKRLMLERNELREIPDTIINLKELETLDLTDNKLTSLPLLFYRMKKFKLQAAHSYEKLHKVGLWLHLNPLTIPPPEIWKTDDASKIYDHLQRMYIRTTANLQRQKIFVLGEGQCGKTSLIRSMTAGKSVLTAGIRETTQIIEYSGWRTSNNVQLLVHDMGGSDIYRITHSLFLGPKAIHLIVYDHRKYTPQNHYAAIGVWLDLIQLYSPHALVKIVGTQCDQCNGDFIAKIKEQVDEQVENQISSYSTRVSEELDRLNARIETNDLGEEELAQLKRQQTRLQERKNTPMQLLETTLVSAAEGIMGIPSLTSEIELLVVDKTLFPSAQRPVSESWNAFSRALRRRRELIVTFKQAETMALDFSISPESVPECLKFFTEIGEIRWYEQNPHMKDVIFHNPHKLIEILRGLFRHDMVHFMNFNNKIFSAKGRLTRETFDVCLEKFNTLGQVSRQFLECLWFYLIPPDASDDLEVVLDLLPRVFLCYTIPEPTSPTRRSEYIPVMVIPQLNNNPMPKNISDIWPDEVDDEVRELSCSLIFPLLYPEGFFEKFSCMIQPFVQSRIDWRDLIFAQFDSGTLLVRRSLDLETYDCVICIKARGAETEPMQGLLANLGKELQLLLRFHRGLTWYVKLATRNYGESAVKDCFPQEVLNL